MPDSATLAGRLLAAADQEFEVSKWRHWVAFRLSLVGGGASLTALVTMGTVSYAAGIGALASAAAAFGFRQAAGAAQSRALRSQRRCQVAWGYGSDVPPGAHELIAGFSRRARAKAREGAIEPAEYWASSALPPGPGRLAGMVDESAFWTRALFRDAATRSMALASGFAALLVLAALLGIPTTSDEHTVTTAKVIVLLLGLLLSSGELGRALAWRHALSAFGSKGETADAADLLLRFADYHVAIAGAPPIPTTLYKRRRAELENLWSQQRL